MRKYYSTSIVETFENVGLVELFSSGLTIPAEIIVLKASSTEISNSLTEDSGTRVYQPVVGFAPWV